jgi:hypothetical protein
MSAPKIHLYASECPLQFPVDLLAMCERVFDTARPVFMWDEIETGGPLHLGPVKRLCPHCLREIAEMPAEGAPRYLYGLVFGGEELGGEQRGADAVSTVKEED